MKKITFYAVCAAFGIFASCQTEQMETPALPVPEGTQVLLTVNDAPWTDESRTAYAPGTGVGLTGEEMLSLYYATVNDEQKYYYGNIKASPTGEAGQYTFTVPAEAEGITHWYGLMPYSNLVHGVNGAHTSVNFRLGPVQFPEANSFDPHCDYLVAQPFDLSGVPGEMSGEIASFKRLFAPLCIAVTGLENGEKIYTATLRLSQAPAGKSALSGVFFLTMDDSYAGTYVEVNPDTAGNAVSAEYATGLEAVGETWPVWLMVNPITIAAGGELTLSVSTADKTYTRTVTLPGNAEISTEQLNRIPINIKGAGYTEAESVTQDFTSSEHSLTGTQSFTASDGSTLSWVSSISRTVSSASDNNSGITGAMYAHAAFTFPTIAGKNIIGARIFCHPASRYGGAEDVSTLTVNGTDVYNFNLANKSVGDGMCLKGGALDITLPDGYSSLAGLTVTPTNQMNLISAITLFTEDVPIDPNDYYAQYEAGQDITINGTVFNKATNGAARLLKLYEMANATPIVADYTTNGILFLDYDEADGQTDEFKATYNLKPADVVIIGRYRNHQPHLDLVTNGNYQLGPTGTKLYLKNVKLTAGGYMFSTGNATAHLDVSIADCTLDARNNLMFAECKNGVNFANIIIDNSVIKLTRSLYEPNSAWSNGSTLSGLEKFWLTNSVVYAASSISYPTFAMRISSSGKWYTPNVDLKFDHDTFYNLLNNNLGLIGLCSMAKLNVNYCVGAATLTRNVPIVMLDAALATPVSDSEIKHNYFIDLGATYTWTYGYSALTNSGVSAGANVFNQTASPFTSVDTTNGYFPIDATVVTGNANGAGASYDTKYWRTW